MLIFYHFRGSVRLLCLQDCLHRLIVDAVTGKVLERASGSEKAVVGLQGLQRVNRFC
ncbi:Putative atp-dependent RNA helicase k03h1.2 in chromosome iii [Giardia duodenalis]|uniref:Putative atp-dependent RNA helicase k03h1.2 in chromosome iii n=1 Tax=Giardia intestinalis TaxID=5741 RepID=V6TNT2_GIAIN|nr:Putative atp-dependent RNA helicase k03h1.2 in chromosome iii [Giardia intestinalis]